MFGDPYPNLAQNLNGFEFRHVSMIWHATFRPKRKVMQRGELHHSGFPQIAGTYRGAYSPATHGMGLFMIARPADDCAQELCRVASLEIKRDP